MQPFQGGLVAFAPRARCAVGPATGVRVNALAPGYFHSEMTDGTMFGDERSEAWMVRRTPLGRGGAEHELDGALLFLASSASSYVARDGDPGRRRLDRDLKLAGCRWLPAARPRPVTPSRHPAPRAVSSCEHRRTGQAPVVDPGVVVPAGTITAEHRMEPPTTARRAEVGADRDALSRPATSLIEAGAVFE